MRSMVEGAHQMLTAPKETFAFAKRLRRSMSLPEVLIWQALRRRSHGVKIRRQHPVGPYVADFYCDEVRLVVEIDGISHDMGDRPSRDEQRDAWLGAQRYTVMRIPARDVLADTALAAERIVAGIHALRPLHQPAAGPPPPAGEERGHVREIQP